MAYGSQSFQGGMITDDVCLSNYQGGSICAYDFPFFLIGAQSGMQSGYDGILGFAPSSYQNGPSFIEALASTGMIEAPIASF